MLAVASPQLTSNPFSTASKDADDAHNGLALARLEFEEGSATATLGVPEGRYKPINEQPVASTSKLQVLSPEDESPAPRPAAPTPKQTPSRKTEPSLDRIPSTWPNNSRIAPGFHNTGNTCFLNSALQCLLHTTPLLNMVRKHPANCPVQAEGFCMTCSLRRIAVDSFDGGRKSAFVPAPILHNLHKIAKHLRKGRQEDAHEFLRFSVDAIQKACLHGQPKKVDPKVAEATWINQIFGGKLRSRVHCLSCGHNSDTFDHIMDLSLDIGNANSLPQALKKLVAIDHLRGADKYKCEKCNKAVNADKQFTIDAAPQALTVHFKRFTPFGKKLSHVVQYGEQVSLGGCMSEKGQAPRYNLYGVVCHAGGGPNSGHYYAYAKGPNGSWYEMNDESVSRVHRPPLDIKQAYMLFYLRDEASALNDIIAGEKGKGGERTSVKRKSMDAGASRPSTPAEPMDANRSQALEAFKLVQAKKQRVLGPVNNASPVAGPSKPVPEHKPSLAPLPGLADYGSDDEDDDIGEKVEPKADAEPSSPAVGTQTQGEPASLPPSSPPAPSSPEKMVDLDEDEEEDAASPVHPTPRAQIASVPPRNFYGSSSKSKRIRDDDEIASSSPAKKHKSSSPPGGGSARRRSQLANPYSVIHRNKGAHDLHKKRNKGHGLLDIEPTSHMQRRKPGL